MPARLTVSARHRAVLTLLAVIATIAAVIAVWAAVLAVAILAGIGPARPPVPAPTIAVPGLSGHAVTPARAGS